MKYFFQKIYKPYRIIMLLMLIMSACVDNDFDIPQAITIPEGELHTIASLKQMYILKGEQRMYFNEDITITGVVTMDGSTDNLYKNAFIEDGTGGINLRLLSPGGLYQGDSIRINLRRASLNTYQNMLQIDSLHVGNDIVKLKTGVVVTPIETDIITLLNDPTMHGRLVKLNNVEFNPNDAGMPYADSENKLAQNRFLRDCNGNQIMVRTSGYASFASKLTPEGNGSVVAVLAQYNNDRQLYIRNLAEVNMEGLRCSQQNNENIITIAEVRSLFNQGIKSIPAGKIIIGVVTSDKSNLNIAGRNAFIQDATAGVALRFSANHTFNVGDRITIFAGTLELSDYNGLLQVNNIPVGNASLSEINNAVEPEVATIEQILANVEAYEGQLVTISNAAIPAGGTYAGDKTMTDGTGSISLFTRTEASFATATVPSGNFNVTGIVSVFNSPNITIRNLSDIQ